MAEFAIDYLDSLSTVTLAERHPQLQQPLYSSLLQVLAPHIQYPPDFTDWDACVDDDEEAFTRFRWVLLSACLVCLGVSVVASLLNSRLASSRGMRLQESAKCNFAITNVVQGLAQDFTYLALGNRRA